jgi:hypothetical protein
VRDLRPVLLGMNNPVSSDPAHALYPHPPGCTGWRLWDMLNDRMDVSKTQYLRAFDRRNLVDGKTWHPGEAARRAASLIEELRGREIVVLGAAPRRILGLPELLVHPIQWRGSTWRQLPHPSGRNLWYNDPTCRVLASCLLAELYSPASMHLEYRHS